MPTPVRARRAERFGKRSRKRVKFGRGWGVWYFGGPKVGALYEHSGGAHATLVRARGLEEFRFFGKKKVFVPKKAENTPKIGEIQPFFDISRLLSREEGPQLEFDVKIRLNSQNMD